MSATNGSLISEPSLDDKTRVSKSPIYIGCAGWSVPKFLANTFPETGSHLERYAHVLSATEINSTFYKPHKPTTFERWAASVSDSFHFSVKMPKEITHTHRLSDVTELLKAFLREVESLKDKLGPLLIQLPPSLAFNANAVTNFFTLLRQEFVGQIVCEPRHETWFAPAAELLLADFKIARVAADPARVPQAALPGGWGGLVYYRLHGSPRMYYSSYDEEYLKRLAADIKRASQTTPVWCIFDNTASGAATENAIRLMELLMD